MYRLELNIPERTERTNEGDVIQRFGLDNDEMFEAHTSMLEKVANTLMELDGDDFDT